MDQKNKHPYHNQHILALDYGTKVIGLASYYCGRDPYPLLYGKIVVKNEDQVFAELKQIIDDEAIDFLVWGVPRLTDGTETEQSQNVRNIGEQFAKKLNIKIHFQDETLSTFEAKDRMKNSPQFNFQVDPKRLDAMSASIILEDFLKEA
jgi:putative Holliday junction resolvase